jgi:hypothetical protein
MRIKIEIENKSEGNYKFFYQMVKWKRKITLMKGKKNQ